MSNIFSIDTWIMIFLFCFVCQTMMALSQMKLLFKIAKKILPEYANFPDPFEKKDKK